MPPIENSVQLALIASFTTLGVNMITLVKGILDRAKDNKKAAANAEKVNTQAAEISRKVDEHNAAVTEKLDENTQLTFRGVTGATQAYEEANNFNARQISLEREMRELRAQVGTELSRLSTNLHQLRNMLVPIIGKVDFTVQQGKTE